MHTKTVYLDKNTLDKFGRTVADMRAYLSKFPSHAEFDFGFNEGADTHGVNIESGISIRVPMTLKEIQQERIKYLKDAIRKTRQDVDYFVKVGNRLTLEGQAKAKLQTQETELLQLMEEIK